MGGGGLARRAWLPAARAARVRRAGVTSQLQVPGRAQHVQQQQQQQQLVQQQQPAPPQPLQD
jgi:hypothetical protein